MADWWLKVADEVAAMRQMGVERPEGAIPGFLFDPTDGPVIETTHRLVQEPKAGCSATIETPPKNNVEYRFHGNGRLIDFPHEESFLSRGRKRRGNWS